MGVFAAERGDVFGLRRWYASLTFHHGCVLRRRSAYEYVHLVRCTAPRSRRARTGLVSAGHRFPSGLHVIGGPARVHLLLLIRTTLSGFTPAQATAAIVVSYHWHFVDIVDRPVCSSTSSSPPTQPGWGPLWQRVTDEYISTANVGYRERQTAASGRSVKAWRKPRRRASGTVLLLAGLLLAGVIRPCSPKAPGRGRRSRQPSQAMIDAGSSRTRRASAVTAPARRVSGTADRRSSASARRPVYFQVSGPHARSPQRRPR